MTRSRRDPLPGNKIVKVILAYQPAAYFVEDDAGGPLRDIAGRRTAAVTGSPAFGVPAPDPLGRGITWSGTQYAVCSGVPTPTSGITVFAIAEWTTAAADHAIAGRTGGGQDSWVLNINSLKVSPVVFKSGGGAHASTVVAGNANDGVRRLVGFTFDTVAITGFRIGADGVLATNASSALTGTWLASSTASVTIGAYNGGGLVPFIGTKRHLAIINRALSHADLRHIASVAFGS